MSGIPSAPPSVASLTIGRLVVLVHDYDEALAFYQAAFGVSILFDAPNGTDDRYLHVGFGESPAPESGSTAPTGIWLLRASGTDTERVGRQTGGQPLAVLYTQDAAAALARIEAAGGSVRRPLMTAEGATFVHVADLYGNEFVLVQLAS
jgi:predicted enzyme related to lactoylglutathione lyase